ncbi:CIA30 family protein [Salegentibacter holothuriorum]|nr:CIA30 family protein [Salegentibacter holothuriorum]
MSSLLIFNFNSTNDWSGWEVENDVVMGGNSSSKLERSTEGNAVFKGYVSLENNGGFASLQYHFASKNIRNYKKAHILLKGDGKNYQFRIKANLKDRASYVYTFKTTGDWQTVEIPLKEMVPTFRGRKLDLPNFSADEIQEVRFLIGNNRAENFRLEIDKIELK